MGYPYIKKGGGGKNVHFHYNCLVKSYKEKKDLTKDAIEDLITIFVDEKEYDIKPGDICITNNNKTMCLGGVMGSTSCAVNEDTKNVVVEAANFDAATIRRTSIRLALSSESSMRFVKGINPNQYLRVLDLTAKLLVDICHWLYHM